MTTMTKTERSRAPGDRWLLHSFYPDTYIVNLVSTSARTHRWTLSQGNDRSSSLDREAIAGESRSSAGLRKRRGGRSFLSKIAAVVRTDLFLLLVMVANGTSRAALILDDFDLPLAASSPGLNFVEQEPFGPFSARRGLAGFRAFTMVTNERVQIDSAITSTSHLTIQVSNLPPVTRGRYAAGRYSIFFPSQPSGLDLTEAGANNAYFVDITSISGLSQPAGFWIYVYHAGAPGITLALSTEVGQTDKGRRVIIPFSAFRERGGVVSNGRMDNVVGIELTFFSSGHPFFPLFDDDDWTVSIDRFGVTRTIPEPPAHMILLAALSMLRVSRRRASIATRATRSRLHPAC